MRKKFDWSVLICDSSGKLSELDQYFDQELFLCKYAKDGVEARNLIKNQKFDVAFFSGDIQKLSGTKIIDQILINSPDNIPKTIILSKNIMTEIKNDRIKTLSNLRSKLQSIDENYEVLELVEKIISNIQ